MLMNNKACVNKSASAKLAEGMAFIFQNHRQKSIKCACCLSADNIQSVFVIFLFTQRSESHLAQVTPVSNEWGDFSRTSCVSSSLQ